MKDVTLAMIAAETNFSIKHVSRALNGSGRVSAASRELILQTAQRLNYRKNAQQTRCVAIISAFYFHWVERLIDELAARGLQGIYWRSDFLSSLPENLFDCAIGICGHDHLGWEWYRRFRIPLVLVHDSSVYPEAISAVCGDFDADMSFAVAHLAEQDHRKIIWFRENIAISGKRFAARGSSGFYSTAGRYDIRDNVAIKDFYKQSDLFAMFDEALKERYTAFIINVYQHHSYLTDFFKSRQIEIPQDISVIVYDNNKFAACCDPALSAFEISYDPINRLAVDMLLEQLNKPSLPPRQITVPSKFIDRGSTAKAKLKAGR